MSSAAILVDQLKKSFRVRTRPARGVRSRLRDLFSPAYQVQQAVNGICFSIQPGERVAFIGPNGAGKSTTLKMLTGILRPDSGRAEVCGLSPWAQRERLAYRMGAVFGQRSQLWYHLPAQDSFDLLSHVYELPRALYLQRLQELSRSFELSELLRKPVRGLSLGERMRCEIAASLLHAPQILFLDEPSIGLDASAKHTIRQLLRSRSVNDGATLLLTSHDTADIESVCDRVIVIHHGAVLLDEPVRSLKQRLNSKRLTLHGDVDDLNMDLPGVSTIERAPQQLTLEIATSITPVARVVEQALARASIQDLSVEDPPLEAVVRALYEREKAS